MLAEAVSPRPRRAAGRTRHPSGQTTVDVPGALDAPGATAGETAGAAFCCDGAGVVEPVATVFDELTVPVTGEV